MIDNNRIKEHVISLICLQIPYLLPLKTLLVIWTTLLICHESFSYRIMILTTYMKWRKLRLTVAGWNKDTAIGNATEKYATKRQGSIDPHALINTRVFITVMGFTEIIQKWGIASWNINIVWTNIQLIDRFSSLIYFTLPVELVFVLVLFLFHWSPPVTIPMSDILEFLNLYCFCWLF